ncbi:MAG TPA: NAD-dependent epimerase/dehydratase family protein [Terriglobales bacterium]|nr:NAD-dependent epimerase/dehydratase family protein [Terriglobales bacterium]
MSTRYLVTGAAGFIGSSLAQALGERGDPVRGVDNFSTGKRSNLRRAPDMEMIEGDLGDLATARAACRGIDVIFHEAAIPSVPRSIADPIASNNASVVATLNVLVAAREAGVQRVIYAASSSAYGNHPILPKREDFLPAPLSPYAVAKLAGEHYLAAFHAVHGMTTISLRYFNVFGPYQDAASAYAAVLTQFIAAMLDGRPPLIHGDGEQSRDFTYIDNVVAANLLAAAAPAAAVAGQTFNIATGARVSLNQVVALLRPMLGYRGEVRNGPPRAGDVQHSLADITRAERQFGYRPTVSFEQGLARTVAWYRALRPPAAA